MSTAKRKRYAVWFPAEGRFVASDGGGLAWTYSPKEAWNTARDLGGEVVDADDFAARWPEYRRAADGSTP